MILLGEPLRLLFEFFQSVRGNLFKHRFHLIDVGGVVVAEWGKDYLLALIIIKLNKELQRITKFLQNSNISY